MDIFAKTQGHGAEHGSRVQIGNAKGIGHLFGQCGLAHTGRSVQGDNELSLLFLFHYACSCKMASVSCKKSLFSLLSPTLTRMKSGRS